jgi:hypothetical protein
MGAENVNRGIITRLEQDEVERVRKHREKMTRKSGGAHISMSAAIRALVLVGLKESERDR